MFFACAVIKTFADISAANGVEFTLRMGDVLSRVIPVLGNVKKSPMKWVFATALGRFAEAIKHFKSNATEEQKSACNKDFCKLLSPSFFALREESETEERGAIFDTFVH